MIKRVIKTVLVIITVAIYLVLFSNAYMCLKVREYKHTYDDMHLMDVRLQIYNLNPEVIIVPGCGIVNNSSPTRMMADRIRVAVDLYNDGYAPKLLLSGDHSSESYNEVQVMKDYAMSLGVPEEDIILDHEGFSTIETMYRANEVFGITRALVVTQDYHLDRSLYLAEQAGISVVGISADGDPFGWQMYYSAREILARFKDVFVCMAGLTPNYN